MNHLPNEKDPDPNPHPNPNSTQRPTSSISPSNISIPPTSSQSNHSLLPISSIVSPNNHSHQPNLHSTHHQTIHPSLQHPPTFRNRIDPLTLQPLQSDDPSPSKIPRREPSQSSPSASYLPSNSNHSSALPSSSSTVNPFPPGAISRTLFVQRQEEINATFRNDMLRITLPLVKNFLSSRTPTAVTANLIHESNEDQSIINQTIQVNNANNAAAAASNTSLPTNNRPMPYPSRPELEQIRRIHLLRSQRRRRWRLFQAAAQVSQLPNMNPNALDLVAVAQRMVARESQQLMTTVPANPDWPSCEICFERSPPRTMFDTGVCSHRFCSDCTKQFLKTILKTGKPYPVTCPVCRAVVDKEKISAISKTEPGLSEGLDVMMIKKYHMKQIRYCSNPKCAIPFDWYCPETDERKLEEYHVRIACPLCYHETCARCRVEWHHDSTCAEWKLFKNTFRLYTTNGRMECPDCGHLIEKKNGCNHVICVCGCNFCHKCGNKYRSRGRVPGNVHGRASCQCSLFQARLGRRRRADRRVARRVERELDEQAEVVGINAVNGRVRLQPWLNNGQLPQMMAQNIRELRCPYTECTAVFEDIEGIERHLATVETHDVFLCCGRPFLSHQEFVQHVLDQCTEN